MKKIVALVLSLVMVLGLATTAFAFSEDAAYYVYNADADVYYELEYVPAEEDTAVAGNIEYFKAVDYATQEWVLCDKTDDGAYPLYDGNMPGDKKIGYVKLGEADYTDKATKVDASLYATCVTDANLKGYVTVNAYGVKSYWKDVPTGDTATKYVLVGDEVVGVVSQGTDAVKGGHALVKYKAAAKDAAETVYEYKCVVCGASFDAVVTGKKTAGVTYIPYSFDLATTGAAYTAAGYDMTGVVTGTNALWLITDAPAASAPADKVESAETFDAGIAMYVGMSVMAAAGSAVVLKKKD